MAFKVDELVHQLKATIVLDDSRNAFIEDTIATLNRLVTGSLKAIAVCFLVRKVLANRVFSVLSRLPAALTA
eukprot:m.246602 g.246602  ORF g.246602 m.246602 type:complete len:72 (+) comp15097_c0_seq1:265-480(+)